MTILAKILIYVGMILVTLQTAALAFWGVELLSALFVFAVLLIFVGVGLGHVVIAKSLKSGKSGTDHQ